MIHQCKSLSKGGKIGQSCYSYFSFIVDTNRSTQTGGDKVVLPHVLHFSSWPSPLCPTLKACLHLQDDALQPDDWSNTAPQCIQCGHYLIEYLPPSIAAAVRDQREIMPSRLKCHGWNCTEHVFRCDGLDVFYGIEQRIRKFLFFL
jgi:hypothetical protein